MRAMTRLLPAAFTILFLNSLTLARANTPILLGGLLVSEISAHDFDCLFGDGCNTARAQKMVSDIALPPGASGKATFETNIVLGSGSVPGAGKTGYAYRVDMSKAVSSEESACVTGVTIELGPITQLKYDGAMLADVFVVKQGGLGTVGLYNAVTHSGATDFTFNQPICAGASNGLSSFYFGVTSAHAPKAMSVKLGWPGLDHINVDARAPGH